MEFQLMISQGSHTILKIKFHDFLLQLLHLHNVILCKLILHVCDFVEAMIFSENETKLGCCVVKESWKPKE